MTPKEKMMAITNYIKSEFPQGCGNISCLACPLQGPKKDVIEEVIEESICDMMLKIARFAEKSATEIEVANGIEKPSIDDYDIVIKFRRPLSYLTIKIKPKGL